MVLVFAALLAAGASFVGSSLYTNHLVSQLAGHTRHLSHNALPSIYYLTEARAELRHLETNLIRTGSEAEHASREAHRKLSQLLADYHQLPYFPGERELWPPIEQSQGKLNEALAQATVQDKEARARALAAIEVHADSLDQGLLRLIRFDAEQAQTMSGRVDQGLRRSRRLAVILDIISLALGCLLVGISLRMLWVRLHQQALYNRLAEEKAAELEAFAGRVAHDIRSPLSAATMSLAFMAPLLDRAGDKRVGEALLAMGNSLEDVDCIISALLAFARAGAQPSPGAVADVSAVLDRVVANVQAAATKARIELSIEPAPESAALPAVACSTGILSILFDNLISNAIKYMGQAETRRIEVRVLLRGAWVRCEVADTGPGIPDDQAQKIFEPFVRGPGVTEAGIGLGLATVRRALQAHGGRYGLASRAGHGAQFWFELPRVLIHEGRKGAAA